MGDVLSGLGGFIDALNETTSLALGYKERAETAEKEAKRWQIAFEALVVEDLEGNRRAEVAEAKVANLHIAIAKQAVRLSRQAARIAELEALYAGTKRSKKAKIIKAKYKALKAHRSWAYGFGGDE